MTVFVWILAGVQGFKLAAQALVLFQARTFRVGRYVQWELSRLKVASRAPQSVHVSGSPVPPDYGRCFSSPTFKGFQALKLSFWNSVTSMAFRTDFCHGICVVSGCSHRRTLSPQGFWSPRRRTEVISPNLYTLKQDY